MVRSFPRVRGVVPIKSPWFNSTLFFVACLDFQLQSPLATLTSLCVGLRVSVRCVSLLHTPIPNEGLEIWFM